MDHHVPTPCISTFNYSRANWDGINIYVTEYNFSDCYGITNIEVAWEYLKQVLLNAIFQYFPKTSFHRQTQPKWFTPDIQHELNKVHSLRHKFKKNQ